MNTKRKCVGINSAKNYFVKWLKSNNAQCVDVYAGEQDTWDYYRCVSAFVGENLYTVYFTMWQGAVKIDYSDEENRYNNLSIEEFMQLIA